MKTKILLPVLLLIAILIGCAPLDSLNPLFTDKDVIFDPALVGHWEAIDSDGKPNGGMEFMKAGETGYRIILTDDDGTTTEYAAHLVLLQGRRFLDVVPSSAVPKEWANLPDTDVILADSSNGPGDKSKFNPPLVRLDGPTYLEFAKSNSPANSGHFKLRVRVGHWFCKMSIEGPALQLGCLDGDWLGEQIEAGKINIEHVSVSSGHDGFVLTAATADLQQFALAHADDEKAFSWSMTARRVQIKDSSSAENNQ